MIQNSVPSNSVASSKRIHPIVIYPFAPLKDLNKIDPLFEFLTALSNDENYNKATFIVNKQTVYRPIEQKNVEKIKAYQDAFEKMKSIGGDAGVKEIWSVDTCVMWQIGLGEAYDVARNEERVNDVFWLIPGDFDYSSNEGKKALEKLKTIPESVITGKSEICLGEIKVPPTSSKQLIDTYGTYGLLYNWFPAEAQGIREKTDKPRTEFFALNFQTLERALVESRWFAYEQTLMILLQNMSGKDPVRKIDKIDLGALTDDQTGRSNLASAMQQVERTERALKLFWREKAEREGHQNWHEEFKILDNQSESIRSSAMVILRRLLS